MALFLFLLTVVSVTHGSTTTTSTTQTHQSNNKTQLSNTKQWNINIEPHLQTLFPITFDPFLATVDTLFINTTVIYYMIIPPPISYYYIPPPEITFIHPTTQKPIRTQYASNSSTNTTIHLPITTDITSDNAYDFIQNPNDKNNNGIEDTLEFYVTPAFPILLLSFLLTFALFISLIYNIHFNSKYNKHKIPNIIQIPVILTFTCNLISIISIITISFIIATANRWDQQTYNIALIPYYTSVISFAAGKFGLEMFFIFRAFHTFNQSAFALPKWIITCSCICSVILLIGWFLLFYIVTVNPNAPYYMYLILAIVEVLFVSMLLYVFTKRLNKLVLLQKIELSSNKQSEQCGGGGGSIEYSLVEVKSIQSNLSVHQLKFIFMITKCILLTGFALVTTILLGIILFYYQQFGLPVFIGYSICAIDMTTNCVCLYLNFAFATKAYGTCCKLCHNGCQKMMEYSAAKEILRYHIDIHKL